VRLTPGSFLGPYEIVARLGAGGMGEVYRGRDSRLGRDVALKVIAEEFSQDSERIRRFEAEARASGTLSHPNVCAVYDFGRHEGSPYVVMELLEGQDLRALLRGGAIPVRTAMAYVAQVADGLAAAHDKNIVHRDLKPENVFVKKDGQVKVLDFGLAKLTGEALAGAGELSVAPTATGAGVVVGTTAYMAPEQIRGGPVDSRVDVFALGVVLYELLTGRRPFEGATPADVMSAILHQEAAPLSTLRPGVPPPLAWLVRRCLAKDPDRRVQTVRDVRNELEDLLRDMEQGVFWESPVGLKTSQPVERRFLLTAAHVRQLSVRNPRLIGYPLTYLDNRAESETLVVFLDGIGGDHRGFEASVRSVPYRAIAITLAGFAPGDNYRPVLAFDDHSQLIRILLMELARECASTHTILVGFSAGADQFLRMIDSDDGVGIDVTGLVALGANVSLETCFASRLYAQMEAANPDGILETLKSLGAGIRPLTPWLTAQRYITDTFLKFGTDVEPLRRYAAELIAPFEGGGDPLPGWYRTATQRLQSVRFVFSDAEAGPAEEVLTRHLEHNILGDRYTERSYVTEPVPHEQLREPALANRYLESVVAELNAGKRASRTR
jgi:serine/threonine protein kinase